MSCFRISLVLPNRYPFIWWYIWGKGNENYGEDEGEYEVKCVSILRLCSFVTRRSQQLGWTSWLFNQTWAGWNVENDGVLYIRDKWATVPAVLGIEIKPWHHLLFAFYLCTCNHISKLNSNPSSANCLLWKFNQRTKQFMLNP